MMTVCDPATGELVSPRTKNLVRKDRRPGFDVVLRMERSAVLAFVACPEARPAIRAAHEEAIRKAVAYFEAELLVAKSATDATGQPMRTTGLIAAGFHHYANRAGDPDLHTHVIVANLVKRQDGIWGTFAAGKLMGAASTLSAIYHMVFFAEMQRCFGVAIRRDPATGYRRLAAVTDAAIDEFLVRTHEVEAYLDAKGWPDTEVARQAAVIATRRSKAQAELLADEHTWKARMEAVGVTRQSMRQALHLVPDATAEPPGALAALCPSQLVESEARILVRLATSSPTRIYREQVVREWARELDGVSEIASLVALVDHTMDETRGLMRRYAADRDGTALFATASLDELRSRLGERAVAEALAASSVPLPGRVPGTGNAHPATPDHRAEVSKTSDPQTPFSAGPVAKGPHGYMVFEAPRSVAL